MQKRVRRLTFCSSQALLPPIAVFRLSNNVKVGVRVEQGAHRIAYPRTGPRDLLAGLA
jgi:hypothetical protein